MNYKFKTLKGKEVELSLDFIKKHVPFWNANKIFIADDIIESPRLDPKTKYSREYQYSRILLGKDGNVETCGTFSDGLSSNALQPSLFNNKTVYVSNGMEQREENWKKDREEYLEFIDILGKKAKIQAWVWFEYLTPSERESIVFSDAPYSVEERSEVAKQLTEKYGADKDFILYRDAETKGTKNGFISITRAKVNDLELMTGLLNNTNWDKMSEPKAGRLKYANFDRETLEPRFVVIKNNIYTGNNVYQQMLDPSNRVEFSDYIEKTEQILSEGYMSNGMRKEVYYELLKHNLLDKLIVQDVKEFSETFSSMLKEHPPGTLIFCEQIQRAILFTGVDVFNIDMSTTYDLARVLDLFKEDFEFYEGFQKDLAATEVPIHQLVDESKMNLTPFGVGIFEFGGSYIMVTPDLQAKIYPKPLLLEDDILYNDFFEMIETKIKPYLEKQKQGIPTDAAKVATTSPKVIQTIMSDAVEVSKRIAVSKVMNIISNTIVENLKAKHKKNNAAIEAAIKFLSSKEGKSVLMVMAGSILPTIKPILGTKYESVIDSISAELRVSGETELASGLVDLLGESLSKAFSNLDLFTDGQEKLRVEVAPQIQASKAPVLDFVQTMEQETTKINGTKIL